MTTQQPDATDVRPQCGTDRCDVCGACLACEPDLPCEEHPDYDEDAWPNGPAHTWAEEDRQAAAARAREGD